MSWLHSLAQKRNETSCYFISTQFLIKLCNVQVSFLQRKGSIGFYLGGVLVDKRRMDQRAKEKAKALAK